MDRPPAAILLFAVGLVSGTGILAALRLPITLPGRIAAGFGLLACTALLLTGWMWFSESGWDSRSYAQIPGLGLLAVEVISIGWSFVEFEPWRVYRSDVVVLDRPLRVGLVLIASLVGAAFIGAGRRWANDRQLRYPLAILSFGLAVSLIYLSYLAVDDFLAPIPTPILGLLLVVAALPAAGVLYKLPRTSEVESRGR